MTDETALQVGRRIKPSRATQWAQALRPALLAGEHLRLLIKGNLGNLFTVDLIAVTNLRVLGAQTQHHCRIQVNVPLDDFVECVEVSTAFRGNGVLLRRQDGTEQRVSPTSQHGGEDTTRLLETLQQLLSADVPADLRAAALAEREVRVTEAERLAAARAGQWPNAVVVGSRPRAKAAQAIVAHSRPGESPWLVIGSFAAGALAAFDDRLLLVKTGIVTATMAGAFGGARASIFHFHDITGIEYNSGLLTGVLEILTPSYSGTANRDYWRGVSASRNADSNDPFVLSNTLPLDKSEHKQALPHLNELRHRITQAKRPSAPTAPGASTHGIAEEVAKLASLLEAGALTNEEFQSAKRKLLGS